MKYSTDPCISLFVFHWLWYHHFINFLLQLQPLQGTVSTNEPHKLPLPLSTFFFVVDRLCSVLHCSFARHVHTSLPRSRFIAHFQRSLLLDVWWRSTEKELSFWEWKKLYGMSFLGKMLNIPDAYSHPLFYSQVDIQTGFKTRWIIDRISLRQKELDVRAKWSNRRDIPARFSCLLQVISTIPISTGMRVWQWSIHHLCQTKERYILSPLWSWTVETGHS